MIAKVGDRVVAAGAGGDHHTRTGTIVRVIGEDGTAPFHVRWSDTGHETLYFPDPATVIEHNGHPAGDQTAERRERPFTGRWEVDLYLAGSADEVTAHAVLRTPATHPLEARGGALHPAEDGGVIEIGEEIATGRALHQLADVLITAARDDLRALSEGHRPEGP